MCRSVRYNDKKAVYRNIVSSEVDVNAIHGKASSNTFLTLAEVMKLQEQVSVDNKFDFLVDSSLGKASSSSSDKPSTTEDQSMEGCHDGCSLLHLACQAADIGMVELLLQYGADINASDSMGQTPLHHCIIRGRTAIAKILLKRWFFTPFFFWNLVPEMVFFLYICFFVPSHFISHWGIIRLLDPPTPHTSRRVLSWGELHNYNLVIPKFGIMTKTTTFVHNLLSE